MQVLILKELHRARRMTRGPRIPTEANGTGIDPSQNQYIEQGNRAGLPNKQHTLIPTEVKRKDGSGLLSLEIRVTF
jgi:hypothetical protein